MVAALLQNPVKKWALNTLEDIQKAFQDGYEI